MKRVVLFLMICSLVLISTTMLAAPAQPPRKVMIALHVEPPSLDLSSTQNYPLTDLVSENMTEFLVGITPAGKLIPGLATSWKISPDGKRIEFALRKGVKFHSGDELTGKDVEFSYKRVTQKVRLAGTALRLVEKCEVNDDYRVTFHFKSPDATFLPQRTCVPIVSKSYYDRVGEDKFVTNPAGTGPYKFVAFKLGEYIDLEANKDYWGDAPMVKEARFVIAKEGTTRVAMLKTGEADFILDVPFPQVKELESAGFKTVKLPAHPNISLQFQNSNPNVPWYNRKVRLAMAHAIDTGSIVNRLLFGIPDHYARLAPWELGHDPDLKPYPYDPKRAKQLLAEAGYPNGFELPLYYMVGRQAGLKEVVEAVVLYLGAISVRCKVEGLDPTKFMERVRDTWHGNPQAVFVGVSGPPITQYPDPTIALEAGFWSKTAISLYSNPEFDKLLDEMKGTLDDAKRAEVIKKAVRLIHDDVATVLIAASKMVFATKPKINYTATLKTNYALMLLKEIRMVD